MGFLRRTRTAAQPATSEPSNNRSATVQPSSESALEMRGLTLTHWFEGLPGEAFNVAWSPDGSTLAATSQNGGAAVWPEAAGRGQQLLDGHHKDANVMGLAWHPTRLVLATAALDRTVRVWDIDAGTSQVLCRLDRSPYGVDWSPDGRWLAVTDSRGGLGVWDVEKATLLRHASVQQRALNCACWSPDGRLLIAGSDDGTIYVVTREDLLPVRRLNGHIGGVEDLVLSRDGTKIVSGSSDNTVRVWDLHTGQELVLFEGHTGTVTCVRLSPDGKFLASGGLDHTVRLWRCRDSECVAIVPQVMGTGVGGLDFHPSQPLLTTKDEAHRRVDCWRIDYDLLLGTLARHDSRRYVNAKVVLLGDSGVGKSGLGLVLTGQPYQKTDSTHGRNVWMFDAQEVEAPDGGSQSREVLLWDLAGQPGYRLVHQLHSTR